MFEMDEDGWTCLHYAVEGGSLPVMRYLVDQYGFDLSLKTTVSCGVVHDTVYPCTITETQTHTYPPCMHHCICIH